MAGAMPGLVTIEPARLAAALRCKACWASVARRSRSSAVPAKAALRARLGSGGLVGGRNCTTCTACAIASSGGLQGLVVTVIAIQPHGNVLRGNPDTTGKPTASGTSASLAGYRSLGSPLSHSSRMSLAARTLVITTSHGSTKTWG